MTKDTTELVQELERAKTTTEFHEFLKRNDVKMSKASFGDRVIVLCAKYETTASALQLKIAISRSQFYSLLNGTRKPSKESVIKIAVGLKLTQDETNILLQTAGYQSLNPKNKEDAILIFGLDNKKEAGKIDELLREYNSKINLLDKE